MAWNRLSLQTRPRQRWQPALTAESLPASQGRALHRGAPCGIGRGCQLSRRWQHERCPGGGRGGSQAHRPHLLDITNLYRGAASSSPHTAAWGQTPRAVGILEPGAPEHCQLQVLG